MNELTLNINVHVQVGVTDVLRELLMPLVGRPMPTVEAPAWL